MDALVIISTAFLFSVSCGILGCYLILRKMAMVGDAISHAVLPGIVLAFLFTGSRDSFEMIAGAALLGIFTTFFIQFLNKKAKLQTDAAIGVTFTWLFALGVILISVYAGQVDLDQECVLYGEIAYVPLDVWINDSGINMGPRALYVASIILLLNILFVGFGYKQLHITTFDPSYAATIGISIGLWNYLLMGAVSMTTVAAFESVGAILIVALLVVPPATAYLLSEKLHQMIGLTVIISLINAVLGYYLAVAINGSIAGAVVSISGIIFSVVFFLTRLKKNKFLQIKHA